MEKLYWWTVRSGRSECRIEASKVGLMADGRTIFYSGETIVAVMPKRALIARVAIVEEKQ